MSSGTWVRWRPTPPRHAAAVGTGADRAPSRLPVTVAEATRRLVADGLVETRPAARTRRHGAPTHRGRICRGRQSRSARDAAARRRCRRCWRYRRQARSR
ncbi:hypothetical protein V2I01_39350 [Micromonospora sp. BRA006-A]|nr:hypothetical protein [Micromonospora sp. BRA006-A]